MYLMTSKIQLIFN